MAYEPKLKYTIEEALEWLDDHEGDYDCDLNEQEAVYDTIRDFYKEVMSIEGISPAYHCSSCKFSMPIKMAVSKFKVPTWKCNNPDSARYGQTFPKNTIRCKLWRYFA